jgi:hypothetical protein
MNHCTTTPSEQADARYDASVEQAAAAVDFDAVVEELINLPDAEKAAELRKAQRGERSPLMSDAWDRIIHRKTGELLAEASRLSRVAPLRVTLWDEVV